MNKRIIGIVLSYLLIVIDIVVGIILIPFLLNKLGDNEYGLYKLMFSTASYLSVLDFGIGGTITRYVVKYRVDNEKQKEQNFLAMGIAMYAVLAFAVIIIACVISILIPKIYATSISAESFIYAKTIFLILCFNTAVTLFNHAYNGILVAYDKHIFNKSTNIIKVLLRILLLIVGVNVFSSVLVVVIIDLSLSVLLLLVNIIYTQFVLKCKIKLYKWDKVLFKESMIFTIAILVQTVINQFNSNLDNVVLGIYTNTQTIAMYSLVLQFFTMYSSLSTAISTVYLPTISSSVFKGDSDERITERVIAPSRIQLIILLLALTGFYLFGNEFIVIWVGDGYDDVYLLSVILLTSATLELSQNTITSVLKAKNILHGKTFILAISTILNAIITFILVPKYGAFGAVIGTAFSMIVGYGVGLNIYYNKVAKVDMKMYYRKTYKGIMLATIVTLIFGVIIRFLLPDTGLLMFFIKVLSYFVVYLVIMFILGFNKDEKKLFKRCFGSIKRKLLFKK